MDLTFINNGQHSQNLCSASDTKTPARDESAPHGWTVNPGKGLGQMDGNNPKICSGEMPSLVVSEDVRTGPKSVKQNHKGLGINNSNFSICNRNLPFGVLFKNSCQLVMVCQTDTRKRINFDEVWRPRKKSPEKNFAFKRWQEFKSTILIGRRRRVTIGSAEDLGEITRAWRR